MIVKGMGIRPFSFLLSTCVRVFQDRKGKGIRPFSFLLSTCAFILRLRDMYFFF